MTQWDKIKAVQRMQEHIEAHLGEPITLCALARVSGYSQWHAARLFKEVTGRPPFEYIRLRRLSAAAERLREEPCKVIDVAFDFVFDSHEGFTRAFARQFGMSPTRFRTSGATVELFLPPQLRDWYTRRQRGELAMVMNDKPNTVFVQVLDRPARKMVVKRGRKATHYFEYCEEVGCDVWDELAKIQPALQEPMGLWLPAGMRPPGTSQYAQGVEVPADFGGPMPEGFELMELPACKMIVFQGPPFEDKDFEKAIASLWDVMSSYRPETYGFQWADDDGPRFQLRPMGYRGYIEGRPVRPV
ncbi:MAG: AraC family transcriptional regulator [Deltaproteobacteria bacterium]|nr:AraC family transcriptional regulator [Deltaproteobacteria bacterium]